MIISAVSQKPTAMRNRTATAIKRKRTLGPVFRMEPGDITTPETKKPAGRSQRAFRDVIPRSIGNACRRRAGSCHSRKRLALHDHRLLIGLLHRILPRVYPQAGKLPCGGFFCQPSGACAYRLGGEPEAASHENQTIIAKRNSRMERPRRCPDNIRKPAPRATQRARLGVTGRTSCPMEKPADIKRRAF